MPRVATARPWLLASVFLAATLSAGALAQVRDPENDARFRVQPPTDRLLSRGMQMAQGSIARGEFAQATAFLDDLLGRTEDYFTETGAEGGFAGLKETARNAIRDLPPEGRRAYETAYGPVAERQLRDALATGRADQLQAVAQRYFYTPAGYQAALVVAANESDAGRHLAAALVYEQLLATPDAVRQLDPELSVRAAASWLAADERERSAQILTALAARGRASLNIGGRPYALDESAQPLEWLRSVVGDPVDAAAAPERQWLTYRGNAARNGETSGGLPHMRVRWKARLLAHYEKLQDLFLEYRDAGAQSSRYMPVAAAPLAAGDFVVVRSPLGLVGVDFRTGKLVWNGERQLDREILQLLKAGGRADDDMASADSARAFISRTWDDYLYGVTSSDGERVYAVRDLPMPAAQDYEMSPIMSFGGEGTAATNRLSAYELAREGSLTWEIDGMSAAGELNGAYFLGAPLAVGSSLYALVEIRDDISLVALDAATGELQWRQQLASLEAGVLHDFRRRLQSSMPSYEEGILVCPTGAGLVVGIDLAKRSLAWAYQYSATPAFDGTYPAAMVEPGDAQRSQWIDNATLIAAGRVLVTPPESTDLHCLDLRTGRLLWKRPRDAMRRLACVHEGLILLVGNQQLTALKLDDGEPAWAEPLLELPRGAAPAGSGFLSEGRYVFALTTAEVIAVDVAAGQIVARVAARDGLPLGNLICHRGAVISQNGLSLDCFDQVDELRERSRERLAGAPDDVDALRSLAEIAYNEGRLSEAIDVVERAYRQAPSDPDVREILAECLADALDADFAAHRSRLPLLKELGGDGTLPRAHVQRIESQGLLASGDVLGAATACLAMAAEISDPDDMLTLRNEHETTVARWVQAQLAAIWDLASADERDALRERLTAASASLGEQPTSEQVELFLKLYGALPEFEAWRLVRARQLEAEGRTLESQQLLLDLVRSEDAAVHREAIARIASQLHHAGLHALAREYDAELAGPLADQPCLEGETGEQLIARWAELTPPAPTWPAGRVTVTNVSATGAAARGRTPVWNVRLEHADSILGGGVGYVAVRGAQLMWHDANGRAIFLATFDDPAIYRLSGSVYGSSRGNLLVVSMGRELAAFNTFGGQTGDTPAIAWRANLAGNFDVDDPFSEGSFRSTQRPGSFRASRTPFESTWMGVIGPMTSGGVIFQDQRRLLCVDPVSGATLWSRGDVPAGCDLFGDDRYVFVTPPGSRTAKVFSSIDGRAVDEVRVPRWEQQLTTQGRRVIHWSSTTDGKFVLAASDPLAESELWRREFAAGSRIDIDQDRFIAVVERSGRAVLIDAANGEVIADHPQLFSPQPRLDSIHLVAGAEEFTLVAEERNASDPERDVRPLNDEDSPIVDGELAVLDRPTGAMRWSRPASVKRQPLVLNLPGNLPFVVFAGTLTSKTRGDSGATTTALLVDKATGRTLYQSDELPQMGMGQVAATIGEARQATIDLGGRSLLVEYTDERRPPQPPAMAEVETPANTSTEGILGILRVLGPGD
jgi:outer membrane protein assembly factor BamB